MADMQKTEEIVKVETRLRSGRFAEISINKTVDDGRVTWATVGKILGLNTEIRVINSYGAREIATVNNLNIALERVKEIMGKLEMLEKETVGFLEWEKYLRKSYEQ